MKKVLGLDLGVGSIGWSLIALDEDEHPAEILGIGCRIVPLSTDESKFASGGGISKNAQRTQMRTMRKMLDRYQQRRTKLANILREHQMYPDEALMQLPLMQLWQLRADAATPGRQLSLPELGRVLYHLSQKRGYRHSKSDESGEDKETKYVAEVKSRYQQIQEEGLTVGQHFAKQLKDTEQHSERGGVYYNYRTKDQVFPREAYAEEFDRIMAVQRGFHPSLTDRLIAKLRDCIFYQRPLKSCKHLVSYCEFERKQVELPVKQVERDGTITYKKQLVDVGPKVAPKSSPLAEVCRIWETLNNLRLYFPDGSERTITQEERQRLFNYLQENDALSLAETKKLLKCKDEDLFSNILMEKKKKEKPTKKKKKGEKEQDLSLSALPEEEQTKEEEKKAKDKEEKMLKNMEKIVTENTKKILNSKVTSSSGVIIAKTKTPMFQLFEQGLNLQKNAKEKRKETIISNLNATGFIDFQVIGSEGCVNIKSFRESVSSDSNKIMERPYSINFSTSNEEKKKVKNLDDLLKLIYKMKKINFPSNKLRYIYDLKRDSNLGDTKKKMSFINILSKMSDEHIKFIVNDLELDYKELNTFDNNFNNIFDILEIYDFIEEKEVKI